MTLSKHALLQMKDISEIYLKTVQTFKNKELLTAKDVKLQENITFICCGILAEIVIKDKNE